MKRHILFATMVAVALTLGGTAVFAQHGGGHGGGGGTAQGDTDRGETMHGRGHDANTPAMETRNPDEVLSRNTRLSSKLQSLLPAGTNVQQAAAGFKNLGQFIAAVHVSHNLGIPFDELKAKMTGPNAESLGKAIQQLKPEADAKEEAKRANKQAKQDLSEHEPGTEATS